MALGYERRDKEVPKPHYNGETQSVQQFRTVQRKCALTEAQTSNERAQSAMKQSRHSEMCSEVSKNKLQETREKRLKCQSRTFREKTRLCQSPQRSLILGSHFDVFQSLVRFTLNKSTSGKASAAFSIEVKD